MSFFDTAFRYFYPEAYKATEETSSYARNIDGIPPREGDFVFINDSTSPQQRALAVKQAEKLVAEKAEKLAAEQAEKFAEEMEWINNDGPRFLSIILSILPSKGSLLLYDECDDGTDLNRGRIEHPRFYTREYAVRAYHYALDNGVKCKLVVEGNLWYLRTTN